jgi:hypothetical protein
MGVAKEQNEARRGLHKGHKHKANTKPGIFTVRLTVEQKKSLVEDGWDFPEVLKALGVVTQEGHKLAIGYDYDRGSYYVIMREGLVAWEEARAVSAWHADLDRALVTLWFYLVHINPEWPELPPGASPVVDNW